MQIIGDKGDDGLYSVVADLKCSKLRISGPIRFLVDTGSTNTVINDIDAKRIGIKYRALTISPEPLRGIGGKVKAYLLPFSKIVFTDNDNRAYADALETGQVVQHIRQTMKQRDDAMFLPSLLGIDILANYTIHFTSLSVILEI